MILLLCFLALVACKVFAAPASSSQYQAPFYSTQGFTDTIHSQLTKSDDRASTLPITSALSLASSSPSSSSTSFTTPPTSTILVTEVATAFETATVEVKPSSTTIVTVVVTVTVTATPSPSWNDRTLWAAPPQMTDLSAFNVTYFPTGKRNINIVANVPPSAIAPTAKFVQNQIFSSNSTNQSSMLQLVYPAHSVNPGSKPVGGADFYASPLNLAGARNVTLEYSVFFPAGFNWVKGGKLPGLFGGHTGCSGGSSASDCFSTRLMWRPLGIGELYLYAPKDKQTDALCSDAQSVCDASYGFSIGRGSFNFTAGDWTNLRQTVVLNTPGQNDGAFTLFVDGQPMINRTDLFYRDATQPAKKKSSSKKTSHTPSRSSLLSPTRQSSSGETQGPLLGILRRQTDGTPTQRLAIGQKTFAAEASSKATYSTAAIHVAATMLDVNERAQQPAEFIGLFFSTFFGGHGKQYATPKRQYTWFKDFAIIRHD